MKANMDWDTPARTHNVDHDKEAHQSPKVRPTHPAVVHRTRAS
ncbi:hypothetical protein MY3296_003102 [Beauveria thailandica]